MKYGIIWCVTTTVHFAYQFYLFLEYLFWGAPTGLNKVIYVPIKIAMQVGGLEIPVVFGPLSAVIGFCVAMTVYAFDHRAELFADESEGLE